MYHTRIPSTNTGIPTFNTIPLWLLNVADNFDIGIVIRQMTPASPDTIAFMCKEKFHANKRSC